MSENAPLSNQFYRDERLRIGTDEQALEPARAINSARGVERGRADARAAEFCADAVNNFHAGMYWRAVRKNFSKAARGLDFIALPTAR